MAAGAAFAYVGAVDPNEPGHYPACPVRSLLGLDCPACGGLRGAHALVHGEPLAALSANALAVLAFAGFALWCLVWLAGAVRGRPGPPSLGGAGRSRAWLVGVAGVAVLAFTVVRNLPLGAALGT
ncbi:DUF2752 domain-containing protein [Streptomyces sp. AJS327]|uniref:DUF2752 domain-containing protein n=1 Tax=Streptomyces sp. AJS327 TaxID=2545265 RepID=UPI0027E4C68A|nr:DUF2752 domain-containing protein [Streptomyces sp. AJS327]